MSGPVGSQQWMYATSGGGFYPHEIDQSLRFNSPDSAYLTRTPSVVGNRKTWTWSGWVKRTTLGTDYILTARNGTGSLPSTNIGFRSDSIRFIDSDGSNAWYFDTPAVYRDCSAWYHIVGVADTTNSTATDRFKLYVNGERATVTWGTTPPQNHDTALNSTILHYLFAEPYDSGFNTHDGYLAEVNFIDGQALDPTDFGEFKSDVWIPKSYSGTYGTNGYYLDFGNAGSLGADVSGNGNNWTPTNLASTDQMLDSPTNNFPTFSPAALDNDRDYLTLLAEGNLRIDKGILSGEGGSIGVPFAVSSGKWYFEAELSEYAGSSSLRFGFNTDINFNGSGNAFKEVSANGLYMIAIDIDNKLYWTGTNGTWDAGDPDAGTGGTSYTSSTDSMVPYARDNSGSIGNGGTWTVNFGQDSSFAGNKTRQGNTDANGIGDLYYAPPAGYLAICSSNLPDPVIDPAQDDVPADYFNTALYTGNGSTQSITGVGFQPDWVWIKQRSGVSSHGLHDVLRVISGAEEVLYSDLTNAGNTGGAYISSFDSDGFTLNSNSSGNGSGLTYVGWNWKAGGSGVSNSDGTVTSTVSANTDAGFSIVTYTGDGASTTTIGHGLSKAPEMYIVKNRTDASTSWMVYSNQLTSGHYLILDGNNASGYAGLWGSGPTSSVLTVTSNSQTNANTKNFVAYCFHSVEGFSKIGSYTGNGDADGPFVYTGFRPAFVMFKRTDSAVNWVMYDTSRDPYNYVDNTLYPDEAWAENPAGSALLDIVSNGFKLRSAGGTALNTSSGTYLYMAFAEMPFKYANAR